MMCSDKVALGEYSKILHYGMDEKITLQCIQVHIHNIHAYLHTDLLHLLYPILVSKPGIPKGPLLHYKTKTFNMREIYTFILKYFKFSISFLLTALIYSPSANKFHPCHPFPKYNIISR